jgi:DnaD/phage-associated family protein
MPNRIIKESICTSASIDGLDWFEEAFFYRLIVNCDDYGRFDARPAVLRSRLFPLKEITTKAVEAALSKLVAAGMVRVYEHNNQPYLQLENWSKHQSVRNKRSKYPEPPAIESTCKQLHANVPVIQSESVSLSVSESVSVSNPKNAATTATRAHEDSEDWNPFGNPPQDPPADTVESYLMANLAYMSPGNMQELDALEAEGATPELIRYAVDTACAAGVNKWNYVKAILTGWLSAHITTVAAAKAEQESHRAKSVQSAHPRAPAQPALSKAEQFMEMARRYEEAGE